MRVTNQRADSQTKGTTELSCGSVQNGVNYFTLLGHRRPLRRAFQGCWERLAGTQRPDPPCVGAMHLSALTHKLIHCSGHNAGVERGKEESDLEEGGVGELPPQSLRARLVLTVALVHLEVLFLRRHQGKIKTVNNWHKNHKSTLPKEANPLTRFRKQAPTLSGTSRHPSRSWRKILGAKMEQTLFQPEGSTRNPS